MNAYRLLKDKQQKEMNAFPLGAAFSNAQFEQMMQKWGLSVRDTDKIYSLGGGCYIRKTDFTVFMDMIKRFEREKAEAIEKDSSGNGFIYDMFLYELAYHEYCVTYELDDTLYALGLTEEQVHSDKRLTHGLKKAIKEYLKNTEDY